MILDIVFLSPSAMTYTMHKAENMLTVSVIYMMGKASPYFKFQDFCTEEWILFTGWSILNKHPSKISRKVLATSNWKKKSSFFHFCYLYCIYKIMTFCILLPPGFHLGENQVLLLNILPYALCVNGLNENGEMVITGLVRIPWRNDKINIILHE